MFWNSVVCPQVIWKLISLRTPLFYIVQPLVFEILILIPRGFSNYIIYPSEVALKFLKCSSPTTRFWNSIVYPRLIDNSFLFTPLFSYIARFSLKKFHFYPRGFYNNIIYPYEINRIFSRYFDLHDRECLRFESV